MAKQYRVNAFVRLNNSITSSLLRLGVKLGSFALLTVRGRKSGKPIETPIAIFVQEGKSYLLTPYGIVNWVRNLRAAGERPPLLVVGVQKRFMPSNCLLRQRHPSFEKPCFLALPAFPL